MQASLLNSRQVPCPGPRCSSARGLALRPPVLAPVHVQPSILPAVHVPGSKRVHRRVAMHRMQAQEESTPAPAQEHPFPEEADFDMLTTRIAEVTKNLNEELCGCSIYLVGMMGSGKSTLGRMLANTMKYAFFDTDSMLEKTLDMPVSSIFKDYGEDYFRDCEAQVLKQLAPYKNLVVATGGGAVIRPMNWSYMHSGVVVWLNGPTDLLAKRVAKEGIEKRPLLASPDSANPSQEQLYENAKAKLDSLLEERTKFYDSADLKISLEGYCEDAEKGAPTAVVMYRLLCALRQRIEDTKAERESRRNVVIENHGDVPSMRVQESPLAQQQQEQEQQQQQQQHRDEQQEQ
ncbi:shikimate kinase [Dunaliella salina]|uniref:shikimate kinase n=1 Tax=Dunaliella salina TaxID=3046 RepID=A0ABQ7GC11_DUNSA|nr:shikimate kinase [Dunaliella salina]|eukprot:KAF5832078.1 shikimate kinase [Dunaliella salina]